MDLTLEEEAIVMYNFEHSQRVGFGQIHVDLLFPGGSHNGVSSS